MCSKIKFYCGPINSMDIWTIIYGLTLILLEPEVLSLGHQYKARPAGTSVYSMLTDQLLVLILISLKFIMNIFKNERCIIPFKNFSRLRVNTVLSSYKQKIFYIFSRGNFLPSCEFYPS